MTSIYLIIVCFLLALAVVDLFVGVSNDAVNFLNSAVGAKAAGFRTVLVVASAGVLVGALMSAGMMDVARHGIMQPQNFTFAQVMTVFLAVMVTDVIILDVFNSLGLPTSTTVSLVFELLGGTFVLALFRLGDDASLSLGDLINSEKALSVIIAIFVSVGIAFVFGLLVQWLARLVFTFRYKSHVRLFGPLFGGVALTCLCYFIFIKGLGGSPFISAEAKAWIAAKTPLLMLVALVATTLLSALLQLLRVDIFRVVILFGTFALAMAFAGNDLVNFIGVPLAGLDSFSDWQAHGAPDANGYMMSVLQTSAQSPFLFLLLAGIIMIVSMATSKKAQHVVKTSVDLSRQDEGDQMFGSSRAARSLVRMTRDSGAACARFVPKCVARWVDSRFADAEAELPAGAAFDMVRAAINLVLSALLIVIGTNYKLPLSTTYVTFMVAMGTSLADRAWSRESAVFRVTGVISVIGGWLITAAVSFIACAVVAALMHLLGVPAMVAFMVLVVVLLVRSQRSFRKKAAAEQSDSTYRVMMRTSDPQLVWTMLQQHVQRTQSYVLRFAKRQFDGTVEGLATENIRLLRTVRNELSEEQEQLKRYRKKEFLALRKVPQNVALERNTWFHLGQNANQQFIYCLKRMMEPVKEHVDNNFTPLLPQHLENFEPIKRQIDDLMQAAEAIVSTGAYATYQITLDRAESCKNQLSRLRKDFIDQMQREQDDQRYRAALVYLNLLQESQELLSILRHQLRAAKRFLQEA